MQTMHGVLQVGPYDWQPALLPVDEFHERLAALWTDLAGKGIDRVVVYGDTRSHAALVYYTGLTPKVRQAIAFLRQGAEPRLLVPGTRAGLVSAKRLTWAADVELLGDPAKALGEWAPGARVGLVGGLAMQSSLREALAKQAVLVDVDEAVEQQMLMKRPRERALLLEAARLLTLGEQALRQAHASGESVTAAVLAAEHAMHRAGAQDAQTLFSLDGGKTLRPFEGLLGATSDPLQAYMAVRHAGYWAAGYIRAVRNHDAAGETAKRALQAMLAAASIGTPGRALLEAAKRSLPPEWQVHPLVVDCAGGSIGTALESASLRDDSEQTLRAGAVYLIQAGVQEDTKAGGAHALASAMVAIDSTGNTLIWQEGMKS